MVASFSVVLVGSVLVGTASLSISVSGSVAVSVAVSELDV